MLTLIKNATEYLNNLDDETIDFFVETKDAIPQYLDNLLRRYTKDFDVKRLEKLEKNYELQVKQVKLWKRESIIDHMWFFKSSVEFCKKYEILKPLIKIWAKTSDIWIQMDLYEEYFKDYTLYDFEYFITFPDILPPLVKRTLYDHVEGFKTKRKEFLNNNLEIKEKEDKDHNTHVYSVVMIII